MSVVAPIHTADLHKSTLRFFRAPLQGEHLPWHCWDDMTLCMGYPRDVRRVFREKLRSDPRWKLDARTVATATGIVTIAPHYMAQGMIGSAVELGFAPAHVTEIAYANAIKGAWDAQMGDLPAAESMRRLMSAFQREFADQVAGGAA